MPFSGPRTSARPFSPWTLVSLCGAALLLTACASKQTSVPPAPAPEATPASSVSTGTTGSDITKTPVQSLVSAAPNKASRKSGEEYRHREDAKALAQKIASEQQLPADWVWQEMAQARYRETVAKLMMPASSSTAKNWAAYRSRFVEPIRIRAGQAFWKTYANELNRAELTYGVPASIVAGVLGVETIYGRQTGNFRVLDALSTLSLDFPSGRSDRSAFFQNELAEFFKLCHEQKLDPSEVLGSYAGAIGWPQFMPSSIRRYAIDFDGDGRIDLQRSPIDAIGSVAKYLADHGWQAQQGSYYEITPPTDAQALNKLLEPDILPTFTNAEMKALGVGLPAEANQHIGKLALVQLLNGQDTPTLIVGTANFYAITRYNQSSYYALAVIQLGQAVSAP
jgi:membrane-bound lytic murein transglycosylase B